MRARTLFDSFAAHTSTQWFGVLLVVLRVALGLQFLVSGFAKLSDWTATPFLQAATGPFAATFKAMAGNGFIDGLNVWGQILIGLALIIGLMVRPASFFGALLMLLYYLAQFEQNTAHGLVDFHVIYFILFLIFQGGGLGHVIGFDGLVYSNIRRKKAWHRWLFG